MIQVQQIQDFNGFGSGGMPGEYFYSQGITKSREGIRPGWTAASMVTNTSLSMLGLLNWFTEGQPASNNYVFGMDDSGDIYQSLSGTTTPTLLYRPGHGSVGNGLIVDQKKRLIYLGNQYVGKYDGTSNYTNGTVQVTNGSNAVVGTGTTFTSGMVGKRFLVAGDTTFYTVATYTDATHITLNSTYGGSSGSGKSYTIYTAWDDQWKDCGSSQATLKEACIYEDWVYFWHGNVVMGLNTSDDSFSTSAFDFPSGFSGASISSSSKGILLGANVNNRGVIALWDGYAPRAVAPWLWFNCKVKSIKSTDNGDWIVATVAGLYLTNGYSIQPLNEKLPDSYFNQSTILTNLSPQSMAIAKKKLLFWGTTHQLNRSKDGIYIMDLDTTLFEFVPVENGSLRGVSGGAIFYDSNFRTHLGYTTDNPSGKAWAALTTDSAAKSFYVSPKLGDGANDKIAQAVKLDLGISLQEVVKVDITFDVSVKLYNYRRQLFSYALTNAVSASADHVKVDGTVSQYNIAEVGDEVTVLEGVNAGQIRHISSISGQNTSSEIWTLDSAFSNTTESGILLGLSAFQLVHKHTVTNVTELNQLFFNVKNKIKGKHYLAKILFENVQSYSVPELQSLYFIYDELPTI